MKPILIFAASAFTISVLVAMSPLSWARPSRANEVASGTSDLSYNAATNLSAYIGQLRLKPSAVGELYVAEAKAREECAVFSVIPSYADDAIRSLEGSNTQYAQIRIEMYLRLKNRCQGFVNTAKRDRLTIPLLYKKAAQEGSAVAVAHNLVTRAPYMYSSAVRIRALGVIRTRNPAAIFELSNLFGPGGTLKLDGGLNLNANESVIVWRLVACDLGYDCSYASSLVQQSCLFGGLCGAGGYRENVRNATFPPHQFHEVQSAEDAIIQAIRDGKIDRFISDSNDEGSVGSLYIGPPHTRDPPRADDQPSINAADPPYNNVPALRHIGIDSNYDVRSAGDTSAAANYRLEHGLFSLRTGSIFKIKYQDETEESVLVVNPNSSLGAVPIPGSQVSGGGAPVGPPSGGTIIIPAGTGGGSSQWACTSVGSGENEVWSCQQVNG